MVKAVFLDFYGTVVHEDGEIIKKITSIIYDTGKAKDKSEIAEFWWDSFQNMYLNSFGDTFETQRVLEQKSLENTLKKFRSTANVYELSNYMFEHWIKPPIFKDSKKFFELCPVPIYIISNIDKADIMNAIEYHKLNPANVFTSEDAKSYKPRKELFELAMKATGLKPNEIIHIGDSISSDIKGASQLGIKTLWLNRFNKNASKDIISVNNLLDVFNMDILKAK